MSETLAPRAVRGLMWGSSGQVGRQFVQLGVFIILARILSPVEFGLIGMVLAVTALISIVSEFGIGVALIQAPVVEEKHKTAMFWIAVSTGLSVTVLMIVLAPYVAEFYREPRLIPLVRVVALSLMLNSLIVVHVALLQRDLLFGRLAAAELAAALAGGAIALLLAFQGHGVWGLAWQPVVAAGVTVCALWFGTPWRPRLTPDLRVARELVDFSWRLTAYNLSNYFVRNSDDLLVGRYLGAAALGVYGRAYALLMLPVTAISGVVGRVMVPALAQLRADPMSVRGAYLRSIEGVAFVAFPLMLGVCAVADDLVLALLGPTWLGMIPVLRIFALLGLVQAVASTTGWIFQSQGRADSLLLWGLVSGPVIIASFVIGILLGSIEAVAASYAIASGVVLLYPAFAYAGRLIGLKVSEVAARLLPVLACASIMAVAIALLSILLPGEWPALSRLVIRVTSGVILYLAIARVARLNALASVLDAWSLVARSASAGTRTSAGYVPYDRV